MIIGLSGRLGVGKDYISRNVIQPFIQQNFHKEQCIQLAFADQLKINTILNHPNVSFDSVFIKKTKYTRELLQHEGTEMGRNSKGSDIWINYTENWINVWKMRGFTTFLLSDVRFKNEIDWIHKNGGVVIRIEAPTRTKIKSEQEFNNSSSHLSEIELDHIDKSCYDLIFNNEPECPDSFDKIYTFIKTKF